MINPENQLQIAEQKPLKTLPMSQYDIREIKLTKGKYTIVDKNDFNFLNQWKWRLHSANYAYRNDKRKSGKPRIGILMHRLILKAPKNKQVDHINGNGLDNRRKNIRLCTSTENHINSRKSSNNTSGYKGVTYDKRKKKWAAYTSRDRKYLFLGYFKNKKDAAKAYNKKVKELFNNFANLNII